MKRPATLMTVVTLFAALIAGDALFRGVAGGVVRVAQAHAAPACTIANVSGSYAYSASGTVVQGVPERRIPAGPFAATSLLTMNDGQFGVHGAQSFNGTIVPVAATGTYTVNPDCTGEAVDNTGVVYKFVVAANGDEIRIILLFPGTVINGSARRQ